MRVLWLGLAFITVSGSAFAMPEPVTLLAHNERTSHGTLTTLRWADCGATGDWHASCINPDSAWAIANGVTGSTAIWTWDGDSGVLASSGLFWTTSHLGGGPSKPSLVSDRVMDLVIDTVNDTTIASDYRCVEGAFLAAVGANGCGRYSLGTNLIDNSTVVYNVGGDPYCVQRTLNGDDSLVAGNPRGLTNFTGGSGCDLTDGAFPLWTVVQDNLGTGGTLIVSNGICIGTERFDALCANTQYLTFTAVPIPAVGWLLGLAFAVSSGFRRRRLP